MHRLYDIRSLVWLDGHSVQYIACNKRGLFIGGEAGQMGVCCMIMSFVECLGILFNNPMNNLASEPALGKLGGGEYSRQLI